MIFSSNWFGQLCSEEKSLFKGVFHLSGIFYLPPLIETSINDPLKMNQTEAEEMSPLLHVEAVAKNFGSQKSDFKVTVIVAENDSPTFKAQGKDYSQKVVVFFYHLSENFLMYKYVMRNNILIFIHTIFILLPVSQCWIYPNNNEDCQKHRSF